MTLSIITHIVYTLHIAVLESLSAHKALAANDLPNDLRRPQRHANAMVSPDHWCVRVPTTGRPMPTRRRPPWLCIASAHGAEGADAVGTGLHGVGMALARVAVRSLARVW